MLKIGKIVGLPLKLFAQNQIYIPKEYLNFYGISSSYEKLSLKILTNSLFLSKATGPDTIMLPVRNGLTRIPAAWAKKHELSKDKYVFILGTSTGLLIYTK